MVRASNKLTARFVETAKESGMFGDGAGLYLIVGKTGARRWSLIYRFGGKRCEMGLGSFPVVSLAEARNNAFEARKLVARGIDPVKSRDAAEKNAETSAVTFGTFADDMIAEWTKGFRNPKHRQQWTNTVRDHAASLRSKKLAEIDTEAVLAVLKPIWQTTPETASRLRGRIERLLDAATVKGLRSGENPARWSGHLKHLLGERQKLTRGHHKALPYASLPDFYTRLSGSGGMGALALRFVILTASRAGEAVEAKWSEIDLDAGLWNVPAERMKAGREHQVPLSTPALAMLKFLNETRTCDFVFPGQKPKRPISQMSMTKALRTAGGGDYTVHGMRSSFRDWTGDKTLFERDVAEAALAHVIRDKTEAAYRRSSALEKRRALMEAWANYVTTNTGNVVNLKAAKAG